MTAALAVFTRSTLPDPRGLQDLEVVIIENNGARGIWFSDGASWSQTSASGVWGAIGGTLGSQADLVAALAAKSPFASYLLAGSTAITAAAHGNRLGFINQPGATTQTFANAATSGATDGMAFACLNKGAGIMTAAGAISAGAGFKLTARTGEFLVATFDAAADAWKSSTPDQGSVQINPQSANYTTTILDAGRCILHPAADTTARTWTIDSNANVPCPIGSVTAFDNEKGAGILTIGIGGTDVLELVGGAGSVGNRTLASGGYAFARKITATKWRIGGSAELT